MLREESYMYVCVCVNESAYVFGEGRKKRERRKRMYTVCSLALSRLVSLLPRSACVYKFLRIDFCVYVCRIIYTNLLYTRIHTITSVTTTTKKKTTHSLTFTYPNHHHHLLYRAVVGLSSFTTFFFLRCRCRVSSSPIQSYPINVCGVCIHIIWLEQAITLF